MDDSSKKRFRAAATGVGAGAATYGGGHLLQKSDSKKNLAKLLEHGGEVKKLRDKTKEDLAKPAHEVQKMSPEKRKAAIARAKKYQEANKVVDDASHMITNRSRNVKRLGAGIAGAAVLGAGASHLMRKREKTAHALQGRLFHSMATAPEREKLAQVLLEGEEAAGEVLRRCSL